MKNNTHRRRNPFSWVKSERATFIPKAQLKDGWKLSKDPKWRFQTEDNYNDGITDMVACTYPREPYRKYSNKEYNKMFKRVKHKLFFHIPLTEEETDWLNNICDKSKMEECVKNLEDKNKKEK